MTARPLTLAQACARYPHRFTLDHMPAWARAPLAPGKFYAPQYASDAEWYALARFPGEHGIPASDRHCMSGAPTWPLGESLAAPYVAADPFPAALDACNARQVTDAANAEFWRRLAGSLRKACGMT